MPQRSLDELRRALAPGPPYEEALLAELRADERKGARTLVRMATGRQARAADERERLDAMLSLEREAQALGFARVAGVDEAGRGPLAGPIVAGAVVLAGTIDGLNDSKQVTAERREALFEALMAGGHDVGIGVVEAAVVDRAGIQNANYMAMAQAVAALSGRPDYLLIDGRNDVPGVSQAQRHVVKGDSRSLSIAAASIAAKVTRDRMMDTLDREYPDYGFGTHKGYGTRQHLEALARYGPCPAHRRSFAPLARHAETGELF